MGYEFKLHDFGARGASSYETSAIGGLAHLVNSMGTDTVASNVYARNYYGCEMAGYSIPASEHSTVTSYGEEGEVDAMRKFLTKNPNGLIAFVSDSYDLMRAVNEYWGKELRDKVLERDGVLVVRPDSGEPTEIVPDVIQALMTHYGFEYTSNGYKLLNEKVRVIQGDGVDRYSINKIMDKMVEKGLSIGNIAFGMGGGLLQKVNRDNFSYSMKTSAIQVNGVWRDVFKDPKTANGTKTSKKGRIGSMLNDSGKWVCRPMDNIPKGYDALKPVFKNGEILRIFTLDEIRKKAKESL
jgi:nicotinamide phosphoribosyltransferase